MAILTLDVAEITHSIQRFKTDSGKFSIRFDVDSNGRYIPLQVIYKAKPSGYRFRCYIAI